MCDESSTWKTTIAYSNLAVATPTQQYVDGAGEQDDEEELREALAQSERYNRDRYTGGESSSAPYTAYSMSLLHQTMAWLANKSLCSSRRGR